MPQEVLEALLNRMEVAYNDLNKASEAVVQWIAYRIGVDPGMVSPSVPAYIWSELENIDLGPLFGTERDEIGRFFAKRNPALIGHTYITSARVDELIDQIKADLPAENMYRILDECVGTGHLLVGLGRQVENVVFYAAEPNLFAYRIAITNAKLNNLSCRILHADYRQHDLSGDSPNWRAANQWNPPQWKYLKSRPGI